MFDARGGGNTVTIKICNVPKKSKHSKADQPFINNLIEHFVFY